MKLLALDQATLTGWAVLDECGSVTESGVWKLADPRRTGNPGECGTSGSGAF